MIKRREVFKSATEPCEPLAMVPSAFGLSFDVYEDDNEKEPEARGPIATMCIQGPLEHRAGWWWESYEAIAKEFSALMADDDVKCVVLDIDSPGGECSGLFETVKMMRETKTKPVIAVANEAAYSAAYALACVADEIYLPESAGAGSVGVIAGMYDVTAMNDKLGVKVAIITSGARKADGNPDVPITDESVAALQARVDQLAGLFFDIVKEARGIDAEALEAGCFYGAGAVKAGLADGVMNLSEVLALASAEYGDDEMKLIQRKMTAGAVSAKAHKETTAMADDKKAEEAEDTKKAPPPAESSEEMIDDKDDEGAEEYSADDKKESDDDKDEDDKEDKDDDDDDGDDDEDASAISKSDVISAVRELTGEKSLAAAFGKLHAMAQASREVAKLKAQLARAKTGSKSDAVSKLVDGAIAAGKLAPAQREWATKLGAKSMESLKAFLDTAPTLVASVDGGGYAERNARIAAPNSPKSADASITDEDAHMITSLGITPEAFAVEKKRQAAH